MEHKAEASLDIVAPEVIEAPSNDSPLSNTPGLSSSLPELTRRDFIKKSASAGLALAATPLLASTVKGDSKPASRSSRPRMAYQEVAFPTTLLNDVGRLWHFVSPEQY